MESRLDFYQIFSHFILSESQKTTDSNQFYPVAPLLRPLLPSMIKNLCHFMLDPQYKMEQRPGPYYFWHFDQLSHARLIEADLPVKTTLPYEVYQFIHSAQDKVIFDSGELGASIVSKSPLPLRELCGPTALTLEPFLNYAFSNDLWNVQGKWPRFHDRLMTLLNNKSILIDSAGPGHYRLLKASQKLENHGIRGLVQDESFDLILTWSYPLAALQELEKLISQEF